MTDTRHERTWFFLGVIVLIGFAIRIITIVLLDVRPSSDALDFHQLAQHLAAGTGYTIDGEPTAYRAPGFPFLLAGIYRLFGENVLAGKIVQALLEVLQCVLLFFLGKQFFSRSAGLIAAGLWASNPVSILHSNFLLSEPLFSCLLVSSILILCSRFSQSTAGLLCLGILWGWAALIKPVVVLAPCILFFWMVWNKVAIRENLRSVILILIVMSCVLAPWIMRNVRTFHKPMISSNGGINLWIGNNEHATGGFHFDPEDNPFNTTTDEVERDRAGFRLAEDFIISHPLKTLILLPKKLAYLFSSESPYVVSLIHPSSGDHTTSLAKLYVDTPVALHLAINIHYIAFIALGTLGLLYLPKERTKLTSLMTLYIICWIALHLIFFGSHRFHYPLMSFFVLSSSFVIVHFKDMNVRAERSKFMLYIVLMIGFAGILCAELLTALSRGSM